MICPVETAEPSNPDHHESAPKTLGDILYAKKARTLVPESDWVCLIQSIGTGDQLALHSLYEQMHRIVFTLVIRITNNRESAEEVTLDVFHEVWRRASTYDPEGGSVVGWIMSLARSKAIDQLRYEQRKKRLNTNGESPAGVAVADDPQRALQIQEQSRMLQSALEVLNPDERLAIEAAFFSESSYTEVAAKLNQPVGTVKTRIRSGLGKLRQALLTKLKTL